MTTLRISRIHHPVTALGPGRRFGVWFQGCGIGCDGCASRDTWDPTGGFETTPEAVVAALRDALHERSYDGVTISGGEPFEQPDGLLALLGQLRTVIGSRVPALDILCFTGFPMGHVRRAFPEHVGMLDAVVAGPYATHRPSDHPLVASANQRLELLTAVARDRYAGMEGSRPSMQVATSRGELCLIGLPRAGDLVRFRRRLTELGVDLEGVSWRG